MAIIIWKKCGVIIIIIIIIIYLFIYLFIFSCQPGE